MKTAKNTNPTLIEIIDYWLDQKKKNTGRMNIEHYLRVCHAKARTLRWNELDKTWTSSAYASDVLSILWRKHHAIQQKC